MKVKGAPEAAAALVYGGVAVSALVSRLGAFRLLLGCSMVSTTGIASVAFSPVWPVTLAGFVLAGFGLGPVVPLLFSLSGRIPDVSSSAASSFVSVFGYGGGGLLFCPPLFGWLAEHFGIDAIFDAVILILLALCAGAFAVRKAA